MKYIVDIITKEACFIIQNTANTDNSRHKRRS